MTKHDDLAVFISAGAPTCRDCKENLGRGAWIQSLKERQALCLACADLDHLEFLPSGSAALTRRSKKYSTLWAVVLKWSRSGKRYERQGLLVEPDALVRAEIECLADTDARSRQRKRAAELRQLTDKQYLQDFAAKVRELYPGCPSGRAATIAAHACMKYSGRVGRSASAKSLEPFSVALAVRAHIRHAETDYDLLLARGEDRDNARHEIRSKLEEVLDAWSEGGSGS